MTKKIISAEDKDLWQQFVRDIKRLPKNHKITLQSMYPEKKMFSAHTFEEQMRINPKKVAIHEKPIYIDGQIDLHGMTEDTSYAALLFFLNRMQDKKHKWGLVITGKSGILFEMTPKWLEALPNKVKFFTHAKPMHGGHGALYVQIAHK